MYRTGPCTSTSWYVLAGECGTGGGRDRPSNILTSFAPANIPMRNTSGKVTAAKAQSHALLYPLGPRPAEMQSPPPYMARAPHSEDMDEQRNCALMPKWLRTIKLLDLTVFVGELRERSSGKSQTKN